MNIQVPISSIMTTDLVMVKPDDKMQVVKDIMEVNGVHHVPVVINKKLVGLISKTDLFHFLKGMNYDAYQDLMNDVRLKNYKAEEIMTENLECLQPSDTIKKALEFFQKNRYHAIPIVDEDDNLKGIITTFDIVSMMLEEKVQP